MVGPLRRRFIEILFDPMIGDFKSICDMMVRNHNIYPKGETFDELYD